VPAWIANTQVEIIIVTSQEGLRNLFAMLDGQSWLRHTPLVVMSERIRAEAERFGVDAPVFVASAASDEGLLEGGPREIGHTPINSCISIYY